MNILIFTAFMPLCIIGLRTDTHEKCDRNIPNKNYAKLRNYLSKMNELDQIVLQKGLFTSIKGHLGLTKGHSENPEGQV